MWAVRLGSTNPDSVNGVAVDSFGDVVATGTFSTPSAANTTGAASLHATTTTSSNPFVLKLNGTTGATDYAVSYGDVATSTGDAVAVNRYGATPNQIGIAGSFGATITFPAPVGALTASTPNDVWFLTAKLQ